MLDVLGLAAVVLLTATGQARETAAAAPEDELLRLEAARREAIRLGDLKTLDEIYADDFVAVAGTGQLVTKAQLLEFFRGTDASLRFTASEVSARAFGDTGVVVGRLAARREDASLVSEARFTHVYVRRDGRFRFVAGQSTPILATPDPFGSRLPPALRQAPRPSEEPYPDNSPGVTPPQKMYEVKPHWPLGSRQQAHATLQIVIRRDGGVTVEQIWNATDPGWEQACRQAVAQWRYEPATRDGQPVAVRTSVGCALNVP